MWRSICNLHNTCTHMFVSCTGGTRLLHGACAACRCATSAAYDLQPAEVMNQRHNPDMSCLGMARNCRDSCRPCLWRSCMMVCHALPTIYCFGIQDAISMSSMGRVQGEMKWRSQAVVIVWNIIEACSFYQVSSGVQLVSVQCGRGDGHLKPRSVSSCCAAARTLGSLSQLCRSVYWEMSASNSGAGGGRRASAPPHCSGAAGPQG